MKAGNVVKCEGYPDIFRIFYNLCGNENMQVTYEEWQFKWDTLSYQDYTFVNLMKSRKTLGWHVVIITKGKVSREQQIDDIIK